MRKVVLEKGKQQGQKHFTVIGLTKLLGEPICCIIIIECKEELFDIRSGNDLSKEKVGYESGGEEYFCMHVGSGKYHPGGTSCTYKAGIVSCLVEFSGGGGIYQGILSQTYLGT